MNIRELSLFFLCNCLICLVIIGWSIRSYYDNTQYLELGITISMAILMLVMARYFYRSAFRIEKELQTNG